ncbi:hypothetical protein MMC10_000090 [Thelotrema lepadinum]|nr:hypothetical protein [Thelotrema lepadinum]
MKLAVATLVGLVAAVNAQAATPSQCLSAASSVPSCAVSCISNAAQGVGCGQYDFSCQCSGSHPAEIASAAKGCVVSSCTDVAAILQASAAAGSVCSCVATASPEGGSTAAPTTPAAGAGHTSAAVASGAGAISSSDAAGGVATAAGTSAAAFTAGGPSTASATASAPGVASSGGIVGATSSFTPFTGGAIKVSGSVGGIMCALLAVIVAL